MNSLPFLIVLFHTIKFSFFWKIRVHLDSEHIKIFLFYLCRVIWIWSDLHELFNDQNLPKKQIILLFIPFTPTPHLLKDLLSLILIKLHPFHTVGVRVNSPQQYSTIPITKCTNPLHQLIFIFDYLRIDSYELSEWVGGLTDFPVFIKECGFINMLCIWQLFFSISNPSDKWIELIWIHSLLFLILFELPPIRLDLLIIYCF